MEEVKAECKRLKLPKDQEKKRILDAQQLMDLKRKEGVIAINQRVNYIIADESIPASEKLARL